MYNPWLNGIGAIAISENEYGLWILNFLDNHIM